MQSLIRSRIGQVKPVWNVRPQNSKTAGPVVVAVDGVPVGAAGREAQGNTADPPAGDELPVARKLRKTMGVYFNYTGVGGSCNGTGLPTSYYHRHHRGEGHLPDPGAGQPAADPGRGADHRERDGRFERGTVRHVPVPAVHPGHLHWRDGDRGDRGRQHGTRHLHGVDRHVSRGQSQPLDTAPVGRLPGYRAAARVPAHGVLLRRERHYHGCLHHGHPAGGLT